MPLTSTTAKRTLLAPTDYDTYIQRVTAGQRYAGQATSPAYATTTATTTPKVTSTGTTTSGSTANTGYTGGAAGAGATTGGTGTGGGGATTGGGGTTTTETETPPVDDPLAGTDISALTEEQLDALLNAISARYNMSREQLAASESDIGLVFNQIQGQIQRQQEANARAAEGQAIGRGILRSGIALENQARVMEAAQEARNEAIRNRNLSLADIEAQLQQIDQNVAAEQAQAELAAEQGLLQVESDEALANLIAALPAAPTVPGGPVLPAAPNFLAPLMPAGPSLAQLLSQYTPEQIMEMLAGGGSGGSGQSVT